jgi:hypothetical protein
LTDTGTKFGVWDEYNLAELECRNSSGAVTWQTRCELNDWKCNSINYYKIICEKEEGGAYAHILLSSVVNTAQITKGKDITIN